jgi:hypothetical protein
MAIRQESPTNILNYMGVVLAVQAGAGSTDVPDQIGATPLSAV